MVSDNFLKIIIFSKFFLKNFAVLKNYLDNMSTFPTKTSDSSKLLPVHQFYTFLHSKLRASGKNKGIALYLKNSSIQSSNIRKTFSVFQQRSSRNSTEKANLDENNIFMWFMVKKRQMKDLIPDIEFIKYREICSEMISTLGSCSEAHFGLGKLFAHEANFDAALQHIRIALSENKSDTTYNLWTAVLSVFRANSKKRALHAKKICYGKD